jgi:translocation and assembly module TamB
MQTKNGINARTQMAFSEGGKLDGELRLPGTDLLNTEFQDNTVRGRLDINTRQLSIARLFYPDLGELSGELVSNLTLDGTLQEPRFAGQASIRQASVAIPQLGLNLHDINLDAKGANDEQLRLSGSLKSGEGSLTMEGELEFDPRQGSPGILRLKGSQFQVVNLPDAQAVMSPDLEIKRKGRRIDINGQVKIPRAGVKAVSLPSSVPVSRDVVFVDDLETEEERRARVTRFLVYSNVKVIVGDDVEFNGYGLRGKLAGDIEVVDEPGKATTGQGALHITQGKFEAFGVALNIDLGRVIFTGGPVDDPGIDARASRKSGDVTAGVRVSGRLKSPEISVFSVPSMPENEAMSYLLFGRAGRETSFAANGLTQPGAGTETEIGFGTYLSPRVYVNYVTSVLNPTSVLRVRFQLTDRWELHTESASTHRAADAVFTIER